MSEEIDYFLLRFKYKIIPRYPILTFRVEITAKFKFNTILPTYYTPVKNCASPMISFFQY